MQQKTKKIQPSVSVIVLTHKNPCFPQGYLKHSISSIIYQSYSPLEIIVANNNQFNIKAPQGLQSSNVPFKIINTNNISRGEARNRGIEVSSGEIIVFIDDDTMLCDSEAISKVAKFSREYSYGFGAKRFWTYPPGLFEAQSKEYLKRIKAKDFEWLLDKKRAILPTGIDRITGLRDLLDFSFPGNFGYIKKSTLSKMGGFSKYFKTYGREDDYLAYCLYKQDTKGFCLLYDYINVLHINHPFAHNRKKIIEESQESRKMYERLLREDGTKSFNINILFGIEDYPKQKILDLVKLRELKDENLS